MVWYLMRNKWGTLRIVNGSGDDGEWLPRHKRSLIDVAESIIFVFLYERRDVERRLPSTHRDLIH